ncbi:SUZ domain-containing protein 1 isoform X1 [Cimex lectularius]|uniref:SUZ RNA-binding domain-containing n=1 Tax=Cimex lectularius TaxID=79782 RepID=A0A8I6RU69_CIMLE|nr:SUZ domain-containing protein 1 isoform X1 [Cimex lectularius]
MADKDIETYDTWEELEDSGQLDKQIEKIRITSVQNGISSNNSSPSVIILSDDLRAKLLPPEPAVKILQRPNVNGCKYVNGDTKPKQPLKTLQQREMEYAEARLRILGEARSPEEDQTPSPPPLDDRISRIQGKTEIMRPQENCAGIIRLPRGPDGTIGFNSRR